MLSAPVRTQHSHVGRVALADPLHVQVWLTYQLRFTQSTVVVISALPAVVGAAVFSELGVGQPLP